MVFEPWNGSLRERLGMLRNNTHRVAYFPKNLTLEAFDTGAITLPKPSICIHGTFQLRIFFPAT